MDIFVRFRSYKGVGKKGRWIREFSSCETKGLLDLLVMGNAGFWFGTMLKFSLYLFVVWFCICLFFGFVFVLYFLAGCALVLSAAVVLVSLASWRRRRGLTFAADPQIRTTGSTLHSAAQPRKNCPPSFFLPKISVGCFWSYGLSVKS